MIVWMTDSILHCILPGFLALVVLRVAVRPAGAPSSRGLRSQWQKCSVRWMLTESVAPKPGSTQQDLDGEPRE